jgi:4-hydroxyphenylpyruvate dioxygenase
VITNSIPVPDAAPADTTATQVHGIDHLVMCVGNAKQAAHFYRSACGFTPVAYAGLETGSRDECSYVLQQGEIRLQVTSALHATSQAAEYVLRHGEAVSTIALSVRDAAGAFERALSAGATPLQPPSELEDEHGQVTVASIAGQSDVTYTFVERQRYAGPFLPGFKQLPDRWPVSKTGLTAIDHVAFSVEQGQLQRWVDFFGAVLGFEQTFAEDVEAARTAMRSRVVQDRHGRVRFPITEPAPAKSKSQIDEYLHFHGGPGAQHAAFSTDAIIDTAAALEANGLEFLPTPAAYYEALPARVGPLAEPLSRLRDLNVLVDRDPSGYLLQVFTRPMETRPTFFLEVIQRKGARGFGAGNVRALFEALEREQARRGALL